MKRAAAAVTALLLGGIIMFGFFGCSGEKYRVDYDGHKDFFEGAKDSYRAGEHVRIYYTIIATDTDYSFYLDGESLSPDYSDRKGFELNFTMPAHDVKLTVKSVNSMEMLPEGENATLTFDSFDGGGPEYSVEIEDENILDCYSVKDYGSESGEVIDGASCRVIITFEGKEPGETDLTVSARSPIADNFDSKYHAVVDSELNVSLELIETVEVETD